MGSFSGVIMFVVRHLVYRSKPSHDVRDICRLWKYRDRVQVFRQRSDTSLAMWNPEQQTSGSYNFIIHLFSTTPVLPARSIYSMACHQRPSGASSHMSTSSINFRGTSVIISLYCSVYPSSGARKPIGTRLYQRHSYSVDQIVLCLFSGRVLIEWYPSLASVTILNHLMKQSYASCDQRGADPINQQCLDSRVDHLLRKPQIFPAG